ncbi:MAG: glycosyltransferase [Conexivisphaera sp.]
MLRFIIPAYNEQDRIGPTLAALRSSFGDAEVIVIFDGDDGTPEVVRRFEGVRLLRYRSRLGKGGAVKEGIRLLEDGDRAVLLDADLPVGIGAIRLAVEALEAYDIVIPVRIYDRRPRGRYFLHNAFNSTAKLFFPALREFPDWQGGFKAFRAEAAKALLDQLVLNDFIFDTNFLVSSLRMGLRILAMPVAWRHVEQGSKVSGKVMKVTLMDFLSLVKLRAYYSPFRAILGTRAFQGAQSTILRALR